MSIDFCWEATVWEATVWEARIWKATVWEATVCATDLWAKRVLTCLETSLRTLVIDHVGRFLKCILFCLDVDWSLMMFDWLRLIRVVSSTYKFVCCVSLSSVCKSIAFDHFKRNLYFCLEFYRFVNMIIHVYWCFDFESETSFDAFRVTCVYKSNTLNHIGYCSDLCLDLFDFPWLLITVHWFVQLS